jgi:DNA-directed RNA polymerase subunit RPC12/RpoP
MIRPKGLNMERIEELFNEHFIFDKADLEKGITRWTISPQRDVHCPKCTFKLVADKKIVSEGYTYYCAQCDEDFYKTEIKND